MGVRQVPRAGPVQVVAGLVAPTPHADRGVRQELLRPHPPEVVALSAGRDELLELGAALGDLLEVLPSLLDVGDRVPGNSDGSADKRHRPRHQADRGQPLEAPHDLGRGSEASVEKREEDADDQSVEDEEDQGVGGGDDVVGGHRHEPSLERPVGRQQRPGQQQQAKAGEQREPRAPQPLGADDQREYASDGQTYQRAPRLGQEDQAQHEHGGGEARGPEARVAGLGGREAEQRPERDGKQAGGGVAVSDRRVQPPGHDHVDAIEPQPHEGDRADQRDAADHECSDPACLTRAGNGHQRDGDERGVERGARAPLDRPARIGGPERREERPGDVAPRRGSAASDARSSGRRPPASTTTTRKSIAKIAGGPQWRTSKAPS